MDAAYLSIPAPEIDKFIRCLHDFIFLNDWSSNQNRPNLSKKEIKAASEILTKHYGLGLLMFLNVNANVLYCLTFMKLPLLQL